jgi:DNA-binding response OmpR family regulator
MGDMKQNPRMLCVDDNPDLRRTLEQQFENEDFVVDTAGDGESALKKITAAGYDIVLLDVKMPNMNGLAVLQEMKRLGKLTNVIMLTGIDDTQVALECVKLGARDFIQKPYDPEELLHIVNRVLSAQE